MRDWTLTANNPLPRMVFKQGPFKPRQDPADMLLSLGLDVPEDIWVQLNKQFMIVADCESYLVKDWGDAAPELVFETTSKLHYTHVHNLCCMPLVRMCQSMMKTRFSSIDLTILHISSKSSSLTARDAPKVQLRRIWSNWRWLACWLTCAIDWNKRKSTKISVWSNG